MPSTHPEDNPGYPSMASPKIAPLDLSNNLESPDTITAATDSGDNLNTAVKHGNAEKQDPDSKDGLPDDREGQVKRTTDVAKSTSTSPVTAPGSLLLEIRALQERLSQLEDLAAKEQGAGGTKSDVAEAPWDQEEKRLRKQIRRARWAKKSSRKAEERAENSRSQRKDHAYEDAPVSRLYNEVSHEVADGDAAPYRVVKLEGHAPNDFATVREEQTWAEWNSSDDQATFNRPKRAMRPMASMRPVYSRKLGPPTQWDMSDSDEWSDGSTRSRDFDYFRARLRGDFEWELDRLHAQRERYMQHKQRKEAQAAREKLEAERIAAEELRQRMEKVPNTENGVVGPDTATGSENAALTTAPAPPQDVNAAIPKLNPVVWDSFLSARGRSEDLSFAIDILVGEPELTFNIGKNRARSGRVDVKGTQGTVPLAPLDGQRPLPERIRINSSHLIMILSRIHGNVIPHSGAGKNGSLVILRPFRILLHYEKEIRDWYHQLVNDQTKGKPTAEGSNAESGSVPHTERLPEENTISTAEVGNDSKEEKKPGVEDPMGLSTSPTALAHLGCLLEFYDTYLSYRSDYLRSLTCDKICFSDIWHLYQPGEFIISSDGKQAYRIVSIRLPRHKGIDRRELYQALMGVSQEPLAEDKSKIQIVCVSVHFDGKQLGPVPKTFKITRFEGERSLSSFSIYPIRFHALRALQKSISKRDAPATEELFRSELSGLKSRLAARGKMFVDVAGVKHMYYAGLTVDTRDEVESQVVIDFGEAFTHASEHKRKDWVPEIKTLGGMNEDREREAAEQGACVADCCRYENVHDDSFVDVARFKKFRDDFMAEIEDNPQKLPSVTLFPRSLEDTKTGINTLREEELLIMSHCVFGYVLRDRTWEQLDLTYLQPVDEVAEEERDTAKERDTESSGMDSSDSDDEVNDNSSFGRLVLPKGHKKMILSLIAQHFRNKGSQDEHADIVRGKGKGLIILLHGAPGVGKTTTAEGVAERFKKPLFQITCGDLGSDAKQVESALQTNFALANRWGCILLLDEADVFLASRRREDFTRNGLVAVFLRVLEYYAGILFLTTNRIGDFDEAFASRIHMSLHYPALDKMSTIKIFKLNLDIIRSRYDVKGRKIKIEQDEILDDVSEYFRINEQARWNGRQIRNACQTALALAEFDAQPRGKKYDIKTISTAKVHLRASHLAIVSKAYLEFMRYLKEVHGTDAETFAKESGTRALETVIAAYKAGKGVSAREEKPLPKFKLKSTTR